MRRPLTRLAVAGLAGHVFFELGAGVGMPLASVLGPLPAAALWAFATGTAWREAGRRSSRSDGAFALLDAAGLAAVAAHLAGWPRRRSRLGVPVLEDCEGLGPELMRYYNPIVLGSGAAALAGLVAENRSASKGPTLLVLCGTPVVVAAQRAEFRRLVRIASIQPAWWNRRLAASTAAT
jgi:hypothetical protein